MMRRGWQVLGTTALSALAALAIAAGAMAAVTVNQDGTSFVGKRAVRNAFGWSNAELRANAAGLSFSFGEDDSIFEDCTYFVDGEAVQSWARTGSATYAQTDPFETLLKKHGNIRGFVLTGVDPNSPATPIFGPWTGDEIPAACYDTPPDANGTGYLHDFLPQFLLSSSLYVSYGGQSVKIGEWHP